MQNLMELIKTRKSVRSFDGTPVSADDKERLQQYLETISNPFGIPVRFAIDHAKQQRQKAVRLDVLQGNTAAEQLYASLGFRYLHTLPMFYEDTGWMQFELYEYPIA